MSAPGKSRLSEHLPGTWLLKSRVDVTVAGQGYPDPLLGEEPLALLVYDRSGHFSVQFMKRDRSVVPLVVSGSGANNTQSQGGYDAYFGTYSVDDAAGTVTQHLWGALSPLNVGMTLTRAMRVQEDMLIIQLDTNAADGTPVTRTLTWAREGNAA